MNVDIEKVKDKFVFHCNEMGVIVLEEKTDDLTMFLDTSVDVSYNVEDVLEVLDDIFDAFKMNLKRFHSTKAFIKLRVIESPFVDGYRIQPYIVVDDNRVDKDKELHSYLNDLLTNIIDLTFEEDGSRKLRKNVKKKDVLDLLEDTREELMRKVIV